MQNYYSVDEISAEIGVNRNSIYQKAKILGIDTSRITEKRKTKLIKAVSPILDRKKEADAFLDDVKSAKVGKTVEISHQSGSTLEQRLSIAKKEFDLITKSLAECQIAIEKKGTILMNGNNGTISSNPAVKTKCELLKQHNALQKTIQDLENAMKMSVAPISSKVNTIDDE